MAFSAQAGTALQPLRPAPRPLTQLPTSALCCASPPSLLPAKSSWAMAAMRWLPQDRAREGLSSPWCFSLSPPTSPPHRVQTSQEPLPGQAPGAQLCFRSLKPRVSGLTHGRTCSQSGLSLPFCALYLSHPLSVFPVTPFQRPFVRSVQPSRAKLAEYLIHFPECWPPAPQQQTLKRTGQDIAEAVISLPGLCSLFKES